MVIYADTSFLFSLYGNDSNSGIAVQWGLENPYPLALTPINGFELVNALHFSESRKFIGPGLAALYLSHFEADLAGGRLLEHGCDLTHVFQEASRLSRAHTLSGGHRSLDILHVAAAKAIAADRFLTFDHNQKRLAQAEGLTVPI